MNGRRLAVILALLTLGAPAAADPPPFGTVLDQWNLPMGGAYSGAGITWNRERGLFYLTDQGYSDSCSVWSLDPADPTGTLARVPWQYVELGTSTTDIPYGICWDPDSDCFWLSQIVDGNIYGECYLLRYNWNGDSLTWGGAPADSWRACPTMDTVYWLAGMEVWPGRGLLSAAVASSRKILVLDPYTKTRLETISDSLMVGLRGLSLVPFDSNYILTTGLRLCKCDSAGRLLQYVEPWGPGDLSLHVPTSSPSPGDTVCAWLICSNSGNTLLRVSLGMLWSQLPHQTGVREEREATRPDPARPASIVRRVLNLRDAGVDGRGAELLDINGRRMLDLMPGPNDVSALAPGVYFLKDEGGRLKDEPGSRKAVHKVIIQR